VPDVGLLQRRQQRLLGADVHREAVELTRTWNASPSITGGAAQRSKCNSRSSRSASLTRSVVSIGAGPHANTAVRSGQSPSRRVDEIAELAICNAVSLSKYPVASQLPSKDGYHRPTAGGE
jgi:hypothetical protein